MKKMNKKGFTLAELLIVVAIIAVLVAIAIPVFSAQLDKSKLAADTANVRSAYAEVVADALSNGDTPAISTGLIDGAKLNKGTTVTLTSDKITVANKAGSNAIDIDSDVSVGTGTISGTK